MYEQVKDKLQQQGLEKRYEGYKLEEDEIHQTPYSGHPGYQKTIDTARKQYFWSRMKKNMAEYISRCMKCQQVKVEHQHPAGLL